MMKVLKKIGILCAILMLTMTFTSCKTDKPTPDPDDDKNKITSENYDWKTPQTDSLKLVQDYKNKSFVKDGIGEVSKVIRYVDGDTTVFQTTQGDEVTIRYNGINTPESTYRIEPWGFAASKYNKQLYQSALAEGAKIVLQAENLDERLDTTGRYLAWIWLVWPSGDSRLVNLELAELGYAKVKSASGTQYEKYFNDSVYDISVRYKLRIWGETDPNYDYSTEGKEMTIRELREQYGTKDAVDEAREDFVSPLVKVSGIVVRKIGTTNAYLQQYDDEMNQYYGIYVYGGYNSLSSLVEGAYVQVTGRIGYYYGALQITDVTSDSNIKVYSFNAKDQIVVTDEVISNIDDIYNYKKIGSLVRLENLKVTGYKDSDNNSSFTLYCSYQDEEGNTKQFNVRVDQNVCLIGLVWDEYYGDYVNGQILSGSYFSGKTFKSITGVVAYYNGATQAPGNAYANGHIQLSLSSMDDVVFAE